VAAGIKMTNSSVFSEEILRIFPQAISEQPAALRAYLIPYGFLDRLSRKCGIVHIHKQYRSTLNACEQLHVVPVGHGVKHLDIPSPECVRIPSIASDFPALH
jgi:hypothetical protein